MQLNDLSVRMYFRERSRECRKKVPLKLCQIDARRIAAAPTRGAVPCCCGRVCFRKHSRGQRSGVAIRAPVGRRYKHWVRPLGRVPYEVYALTMRLARPLLDNGAAERLLNLLDDESQSICKRFRFGAFAVQQGGECSSR